MRTNIQFRKPKEKLTNITNYEECGQTPLFFNSKELTSLKTIREYGTRQLVYVTYNENARDNAANQIKEIVDFANCKTIFEFFYDIAKPDLEGLTYADENNFVSWWKNEITNHLLKIKMNSLSKSNPINYVYTFYRGLYKGSMFRWELTHDDKCLTREQMLI